MFVGLEDIDHSTFLRLSQSGLRGHPYKSSKPYFLISCQEILSSVRVIDK